MSERGFKDGAIILIISQVGNSDEATKYLRRLEADDYIKDMVYCSHERLDELLDNLKKNKYNPTGYTALVCTLRRLGISSIADIYYVSLDDWDVCSRA